MTGWTDVAVDAAKLRDYCLSDVHPRGRHKARVFKAALGLTADDAELLRDTLVKAAWRHRDALSPGANDEHGQRYLLDFPMRTPAGTATVRSSWIVRRGEAVLRLTTCFVKMESTGTGTNS